MCEIPKIHVQAPVHTGGHYYGKHWKYQSGFNFHKRDIQKKRINSLIDLYILPIVLYGLFLYYYK